MPLRLGFTEQVPGQRVLVDNDRNGDVLPAIDHVRRLQTLGIQPAHVEGQQLLQLVGCET